MLLEIGLDDKPTYALVVRVTLERLGATVDDGIRPPAGQWVDGAVAERATDGLQSFRPEHRDMPPRLLSYRCAIPNDSYRSTDGGGSVSDIRGQ